MGSESQIHTILKTVLTAQSLHNDRDQKHREATLADFKVGRFYY